MRYSPISPFHPYPLVQWTECLHTPQIHVVKPVSPMGWYLEVGTLGGDFG